MINNDRIVPITAVDLLTMYGLVLAIGLDSAPTKLDATDTAGDFSQTTNSATVICSEPVKSFNFGSGVSAGTVYFVPALDYVGFTLAGVATVTAGAEVTADGKSLYKAVLSSGTVTITALNL